MANFACHSELAGSLSVKEPLTQRWQRYSEEVAKAIENGECGAGVIPKTTVFRRTMSRDLEEYAKRVRVFLTYGGQHFPADRKLKVLEIGAGYGGFFCALHDSLPIEQYVIVDTVPMIEVCRAFLGELASSVDFVTPDRLGEIDRCFDLFVSHYCLSEAPKPYQEVALQKASECECFYIIDKTKYEIPDSLYHEFKTTVVMWERNTRAIIGRMTR